MSWRAGNSPRREKLRVACRRLHFEQLELRLPLSNLPTGFTESLVSDEIQQPTAMELAPDGRIFVAEQGGNLRVIKNGSLLSTPFLHVNVDSTGERGLLGIAFDPDFDSNQFIYVYYTTASSPVHNRVSRFTANGDMTIAGSETILLDLDNLSGATNHNGGAIHFGLDGSLYMGVGDNANGSNAQTINNLLGKVLRIRPDGTFPSDNPFFSTATGRNRAIWALGLRNPFTFAVQPGTGRIFVNDVGQVTWEEINDGVPGGNYGWPQEEGIANNPLFRDPLFAYGHGSSDITGCAIAGGSFYNPDVVQFPADFVGDYFFADLCSAWIRRYDIASDTAIPFATDLAPAVVDLKVSSNGSLYYLARGDSASAGAVYRIDFPPVENEHPWQNPFQPTDVDGQFGVVPLDALIVINYLNETGAGPLAIPPPQNAGPPPFLDVNGDDFATPLDVLVVINFINQNNLAPGLAAMSGSQNSARMKAPFDTRLFAKSAVWTSEPSPEDDLTANALRY